MPPTTQGMAVTTLPLWINGKPTPASGSRSTDVFDPASGQVIRRVPLADQADIDKAVAVAKAAFPAWRDTPPLKRARILTRYREVMQANQDDLVRRITSGKDITPTNLTKLFAQARQVQCPSQASSDGTKAGQPQLARPAMVDALSTWEDAVTACPGLKDVTDMSTYVDWFRHRLTNTE